MRQSARFFCAALLFLFSLSACRTENQPAIEPDAAALQLAAYIVRQQAELPAMISAIKGEEDFSFYLTNYYGMAEDLLEDGAICYAGGVEASEIAVLVLKDAADMETAEEALKAYKTTRTGNFAGYAPAQADIAENGLVTVQGRYAALLICPDPEAARKSFQGCFEAGWTPPDTEGIFQEDGLPSNTEGVSQKGGLPSDTEGVSQENGLPPEPAPSQDTDAYDHDAIVSAFHSGESSTLSAKNQAILTAVSQALSQLIDEKMTPYEKELAVHDYIIHQAVYDPEALSNAPNASPDPDNINPYGVLINGLGICEGFSSTFQLFMDLLDIPCITVTGTAYSGTEEHAWNMVQLDEDWYCVDVTWNVPVGASPYHMFFNVTSQFLQMTDHQWDTSSVPEATATAYAWDGRIMLSS